MFRRGVASLAFAVLAVMALAGSALASGGTIAWKGQTWDVSANATATVDGDDHLTVTRDTGTNDAYVHVNRLLPLVGGESFVNEHGTPWIQVSYLDNGAFRGVDFFVDDEVTAKNPRLQAGSLFSCDGIGYARYSAPATTEEVVFAVPNDGTACTGTRTAGTPHTIYAGERADGTIDYNFDGTWYSSTLIKDNVGHMNFNDVYLRLRGSSGTTATFTDFQYGANHPSTKADCKKAKGSLPPAFRNQGSCVSYFASGK
ncbi:MAG TPA: hypothetical protein VGB19_13595 [Actinomycetota bacterium]